MLFPTITFAVFFLLVYAANWLLMPRFRLWKWMIIGASYVFYGWWDWRFVLLLVAATFVNQALGVQIARARERRGGGRAAQRWLALSVVANLAALGYFKYVDFFAVNLDHLLSSVGLGAPLPLLRILLPVGISFLVFRVLTYTIDIYRGELAPASTLDFGVYVAFFPYLLAGPIARARDFLPQLSSPRDPHSVDAGRAFILILGGLAKKILIADYLSTHIVNGVFASPQSFSSWETLWGIVAYSVQIYCDFSAYSDIAIGISLLLGFELPENFNAPYTARTIQDFWRRWHITLSSWLRDYLYIPLGGSRKGRGRTYVNLIVTFLLAGLWHGAGWTFVFWGGMHGVGLALERARGEVRKARGLPEPGATAGARALQRLAVFAFVSVAWVFFRADSIGGAFAVLWRLVAGLGSIGSAVTWPVVGLVVLGIGIQYVPRRLIERLEDGLAGIGWAGQGAVLALALFLIDTLGPQGAAEFLYFKF
ncbi:MAG: MBOAT family protein [Actinobacteria bacterium]|nr:MBOAT family protein [Actinomycetota bacterium]